MIGDARAFSAYACRVRMFEALPVGVRRVCYRVAHRLLRVYWFVLRPTTDGAKCVLTRGDQVLLVRHTYGRSEWDLPGGTVRRGEPPAETARREMHEELGVAIDDWTSLGRIDGRVHHHPNRLHCFHEELDHADLVFDAGEIAAAGWFARDRLPADTSGYARQIIRLLDR
jgi:8-oxo-dGTP diphosphatase